MKIRHIALLMFAAIALTSGAIAFGYFLSSDQEEESGKEQAVRGSSTNLSVSQSRGVGQLLPGDGQPSPNSSSNSLPGPDQFGQYEQYANETSALYAETRPGQGAEAGMGDTVAVVYEGWLTDGTLFDSSKKNEKGEVVAFQFTIGSNQVIRGWEEGILGMKVGGRRRIVVPSAVGYGTQGNEVIPPNALLIFDVELVQISPQETIPGL